MTPIRFVTSFSTDGYKLYGKQFIESALKHFPQDCEIWVYYESKNPCDIRDKRLKFINLFKVPGVAAWLQAIGGFPMFRGQTHGKRNYRYDAYRFSRKIFAQCDAAADYKGLLFWVDADTLWTEDLTEEWLRGAMEDKFIAYMNRPSWHLCASFVGWNTNHPQSDMFWLRYWNLMMTGEFVVLPEWHDSYILAALIDGLDLDARDLAGEIDLEDGPVNVFNHVFKRIATHAKGNLKYGPQRYSQLIQLVGAVKPSRVIEIGTWNGDRAIQMAEAVSPFPLDYVGFDLFEHATPETDEEEKNVKPHFTAKEVSDKLSGYGIHNELVVGNTNMSFARWISDNPDKKADVVYIDGGHAVETIDRDLRNAMRCVTPDGYIVLDDWYEDMPEEDLEKWGCNKVLKEAGFPFEILPVADPVKGGGMTKMVVIKMAEVTYNQINEKDKQPCTSH